MYESFYGLSAKPFSLLPDAGFLYFSKRHRQVVNLLEYGMATQAGFVVVSGDVGAGKTTIIRHFLKNAASTVTIGVVTNPSPTCGRLLDWVVGAYEIEKPNGADDIALYNIFVDFLVAQYGHGRHTVLIIDEAQNLTVEMLEELRMLSNVNNEPDFLLQIILAGQPELRETLKRPDIRQFVQRVAVHCHLTPLEADETAAYIRHRFALVGGRADVFDDMACAAVHYFTGGVPRLINLLCDQALTYGYGANCAEIPFGLVAEAAFDRASTGLSPFINVPDVLRISQLEHDLQDIVDEISGAEPLARAVS